MPRTPSRWGNVATRLRRWCKQNEKLLQARKPKFSPPFAAIGRIVNISGVVAAKDGPPDRIG
ncbi:MAG TPA: hypothetical protein VFB76_05800 [Candidatus Angelobacter sp.]|nr:hypothetical protein [Candidatus Angelobacter sp.]